MGDKRNKGLGPFKNHSQKCYQHTFILLLVKRPHNLIHMMNTELHKAQDLLSRKKTIVEETFPFIISSGFSQMVNILCMLLLVKISFC